MSLADLRPKVNFFTPGTKDTEGIFIYSTRTLSMRARERERRRFNLAAPICCNSTVVVVAFLPLLFFCIIKVAIGRRMNKG